MKRKVIKNKKQKRIEAYSEKILIACQNGKPCNYGICDECPNTLGNVNNRKGNKND